MGSVGVLSRQPVHTDRESPAPCRGRGHRFHARARIPDLPFRVRHYRHRHAIGHPQGASHGRQLLMASERDEDASQACQQIISADLQRSGTSAARTLLALALTTPSYARLRVSRKRTLTPVIHHQLAKAFPRTEPLRRGLETAFSQIRFPVERLHSELPCRPR